MRTCFAISVLLLSTGCLANTELTTPSWSANVDDRACFVKLDLATPSERTGDLSISGRVIHIRIAFGVSVPGSPKVFPHLPEIESSKMFLASQVMPSRIYTGWGPVSDVEVVTDDAKYALKLNDASPADMPMYLLGGEVPAAIWENLVAGRRVEFRFSVGEPVAIPITGVHIGPVAEMFAACAKHIKETRDDT